jgi:site-specific DNA-methyltransferase (adenine-specific)
MLIGPENIRTFSCQSSALTIINADCVDARFLIHEHLRGLVRGLVCKCAIVTDPPYGIGFSAQPTTGGRKRGQTKEAWDDETNPVALYRLLEMFPEYQAVWGGNYYDLKPSRGWLVWHKPDAPPSMGSVELCWTNRDQNSRIIDCSIASTNPERVGHPTQKPLKVIARTIEFLNLPVGSLVCDPFMGSGTTAIACIALGMNFIGVERDPVHFQTACRRIEKELNQFRFNMPAAKPAEQPALI